jgi:hypothetical protein
MSNLMYLGYEGFVYPPVTLTYSTATVTDRTARTMTATPNPDPTGNTGYASSAGVRGLSLSVVGTITSVISADSYPNYSVITSINPQNIGSYTGTITPTIRDFLGNIGVVSGAIPVSLTRSFIWGANTLQNVTTSVSTDAVFLYFDNLEYIQSRRLDTTTASIATVIQANQSWNSIRSTSQNANLYNEVMFEHVSGSTGWYVTTSTSPTTASLSKNTYYTMTGVGIGSAVNTTPSSTVDSVVRVTMRNILNTSLTFQQLVTLRVTRT